MGYDGTNKFSADVSSTGTTTFTASGGSPAFNFTGGFVGVGVPSPGEAIDVSGSIRASTSVKAPLISNTEDLSLTADSDNNSTGALIFRTGTNERLRVLNSGYVGIGTTTPSMNLSFGGNTPQMMGMERSSAGNGGNLTIKAAGGLPGVANMAGGNLILASGIGTGSGGSRIEFQTSTPGAVGATTDNALTTKMAIDSVGNVGIGNAGSSSYKLFVYDGAQTGRSMTHISGWNTTKASSNTAIYNTGVSGVADIKVDGGFNNPGIASGGSFSAYRASGWTNDKGTLDTLRGIVAAYGHSNTASSGSPTTNNAYGLQIRPLVMQGTIGNMYDIFLDADSVGGTATKRYGIYQANSAKNYFAGDVGIGTVSPQQALDVTGSIAISGIPVITSSRIFSATNGSVANPSISFQQNANTGISAPGVNSNVLALTTNSSERMRIDATGKIGFGTPTPQTKMHVLASPGAAPTFTLERSDPATDRAQIALYPGGALSAANVEWDVGLIENSNDYTISTWDGSTATGRLTIRNTGNVGIGVSAPTEKLTVAGNIVPSADNSFDLGTSGLRFRNIELVNAPIVTSDVRQKVVVKDSDLGLSFVNKLRPVSYFWKEGDDFLHYGLIAQETERALASEKLKSEPKADIDNVIVTHNKKTDRYGVRYMELIAPIIKAIQEIYQKLMGQETRLATLEAKVGEQRREIASKSAELRSLHHRIDRAEKENAALKAYLCAKDKSAAFCKR